MKEEGRYEKRYVVATRDDGLFRIQILDGKRVLKSADERLDVCQNCLHGLSYKGFNRNRSAIQKRGAIDSFSLRTFFEEFGTSPIFAMPEYDAIHAPTNVYSVDFFRIAKLTKERRGMKCEQCGLAPEPRHLHVHHKNAQKSDNSDKNLLVLCAGCHAEAPWHGHMKGTPGFEDFQRRYRAE